MRFMVLWFPDWPVHAVRLEGDTARELAVVHAHRVWACSAQARAHGVKRGMRARQAQALAASLRLVERDEERDARVFESVVQELDSVVASIEVLRPGLAVVDAGAAARFHGGEEKAAQLVLDAASLKGVDCAIGIADNIETAVLAARSEQIVPPGGNTDFLAGQPTKLLLAEESLGCDRDTVEALLALGLSELGDIAQLPTSSVVTRFGAAGARIMHIARGLRVRKVAPPWTGPSLEVSIVPEEPINRVDAAAFVARGLAAKLHATLHAAGVVCQRLRVSAVIESGGKEITLQRTWRTQEPLSEAATADRVRWQLDGWLTARGLAGETAAEDLEDEGQGGIIELILDPLEVGEPDRTALWGGVDDRAESVRKVVARVQSILGIDAVLQPISAGGRGVAERVELIPYGEDRAPTRPAAGAWHGALPGPLPARARHPAATFQLIDAHGAGVYVTAEVVLSGTPVACAWGSYRGRVTAWAGPWPVAERWWEDGAAPACARLQVVAEHDAAPRAFLVVWLAGRWRVEATYD
ncbi:DNA polymerase Y family protein [Staphylococcus chromogenes]|nr:DNA polymerase Y family protein [Staphylococcus chromogenes]